MPQGIVPFVFAKEYNVHPDILSTGFDLDLDLDTANPNPRFVRPYMDFFFLQGYIWDADSSTNNFGLLHFVGTLKAAKQLKCATTGGTKIGLFLSLETQFLAN